MAGCLGDQTIAAYVDGALDLDGVAQVDHHIDGCATCRSQLSALAASPVLHSFVADADPAAALAITAIDGVIATGRAGDPLSDLVIGRYVAETVIGRGAMGVVIRARDPELERAIAIKLVDPVTRAHGSDSGGWRSRLRGEARAMARLRHPNVVTVYDAGAVGDQLFVAMELVDGDTLSRRIARDRSGVLALCVGAGRGLCAAHAAGVIHGDVKPDNILVDRDGRALIGDFGLARAIGDGPATADGRTLIGTPAYMAPERLRGGPPDLRADQFAFAVTVYEAYAGRRPWHAGSVAELIDVVERDRPLRPREMPAAVWREVERALAIDPVRRHRSLPALVDALERAGRRGRTRIAIAGAAALGVAAIGVAVAVGAADPGPACADPRERAAAITRPGLCGPSPEPWCTALAAELANRAASWRTTHVAVCRATRDGRQSAELLDRRIHCLDQGLAEHAALASRLTPPLAKADGMTAVAALYHLDRPERCATFDRPVAAIPPERAAAIREAHAWVTAARADYMLGRYPAGLAALTARMDAIRALAHPALVADASRVLGELQLQNGHLADAEATLDAGLQAAAEAGDDLTTAYILIELAHVRGEFRQQWERATELLRAADAAVVRAGSPPELAAAFLVERGGLAESHGDLSAAIADYTRALALRREAAEPTEIGIALQRVCVAEHQIGKIEEAVAHCREALVMLRQILGDDHPLCAEAEINLGVAVAVSGELGDARQLWESALARLERGLGATAPVLAIVLLDLEDVSRELGDRAAAERYLARAVAVSTGAAASPDGLDVQLRVADQLRRDGKLPEAISRLEDLTARAGATLGDAHPTTARARDSLGAAYYDAERYPDARRAWGEGLTSVRALYGERHPSTLTAEGQLGQAMMMMDDPRAARPLFDHALLVLQADVDADSPNLANAYTNAADCAIALGDAAAAVAPARAGLAIREARGDDPLQTSEARFVLARALWRADRDRTAVALARTARDEMRAIGPTATTLPDIERWLAGHR